MAGATKVKLLGWLHVVLSGAGLVCGVVLLMMLALDKDSRAGVIVVPVVLMLSAGIFIPGLIGGVGLLLRRRWARLFMIAFSALELLVLPVGTVIGAIGLWILLGRDAKAMFEADADAAGAVSTSSLASQAAAFRLDPKTINALITMAGVAAGIIVGLNVGFILSGSPAPVELAGLLYPAASVLVVTLAMGMRALARMLARSKRPALETSRPSKPDRAAQQQRLAQLAADPVRRRYAALIERGESWTDAQIAYDLDPAMTATCQHLQAIERAIRRTGIKARRYAGADVGVACALDPTALAKSFALPRSVRYEEPPPHDRASADSLVALLRCTSCRSSIVGWHPSTAGPHAPVFPPR